MPTKSAKRSHKSADRFTKKSCDASSMITNTAIATLEGNNEKPRYSRGFCAKLTPDMKASKPKSKK